MKIKQTLILVLAMVVPIGVFIFLKIFGKNQFEVDPLYQTGTVKVNESCEVNYRTPYQIPIHVLEDLNWKTTDSLTLYFFKPTAFNITAINNRVSEVYATNEVRRNIISQDSIKLDKQPKETYILNKDAVTTEQLQECFFLMNEQTNTVLIDNKQRIRGYYNLKEREDADRLLLELKIILKKYKHE